MMPIPHEARRGYLPIATFGAWQNCGHRAGIQTLQTARKAPSGFEGYAANDECLNAPKPHQDF